MTFAIFDDPCMCAFCAYMRSLGPCRLNGVLVSDAYQWHDHDFASSDLTFDDDSGVKMLAVGNGKVLTMRRLMHIAKVQRQKKARRIREKASKKARKKGRKK